MAESRKEKIDKLQLEITQVTRTESLLNQNQIQKIFNSTPQKYKYSRPAKGGGNWTYIKSSYVRRVLDSVFGFNWDFDVETSLSEAFEVAKLTKVVVVKGTLTARVRAHGEWVELKKTQFGRSEVKMKRNSDNEPLDFGNDMKAAVSDCLKKCASLLGIGADVYEAEEFQEIEIIGSEDNSKRKKNQERMVKEAKETLKKEAEEVPRERTK